MSKQEAETTTPEEVDTSTYEDPMDSLEDSEVSFDDADDDSEDLETEVESTEEAEVESEDDVAEETDDEADDAESEEPEAEDESPQEEDTASDEQESQDESNGDKTREELAQEAFKRREAERKLREANEQREVENLQRYLDEAKEDEVELFKRQQEVQAHLLSKERSQVLQDKIDVGIQRAVSELGLDKAPKAVLEKLGRELDKFEAGNVIKDNNGNILRVNGDVYQYIKEEMDFISQFQSVGAREQAKNKVKEHARTVKTPTRTPKEKVKDSDIDDFEKAFYGEDD